MLISPTEPPKLKRLGKTSSKPEEFGCDFLFVHKGKMTGVQRKKFPEDLLSSLKDGRVYSQLQKMQKLDRVVVLLEGYGKWTSEGRLLDAAFTREQLYGTVLSLAFEYGVEVFQVRDMHETIRFLKELDSWGKKGKHTSFMRRPGPQKDSWGKRTDQMYALHILQSFDGVGPGRAKAIFDHFGRVPIRWDLEGWEEIAKVKGIGKETAKKVWRSLDGE